MEKIDTPWRLIGNSNIEHVFLEMDGAHQSENSLGEIAFEPYVLGLPKFISVLVSIRDDMFEKLWRLVVSEKDIVWGTEISFSGEPGGKESWLPVKDIRISKVYTRQQS